MGNILKKRIHSPARPTVRHVVPNHLIPAEDDPKQHPNHSFLSNKVKTTKYTVLSFVPKNIFEQFHRVANLYFLFVVLLNWVPQVNAFGKEVAMLPLIFVLGVTAIKDGYEDYRRYRADKKVNHQKCRLYSRSDRRYVRGEWQDLHVGDAVHLSCNEVIPADIVILRSSDEVGACYIDTSNIDGENNLKQRQVVGGLQQGEEFHPTLFTHTIECDVPNMDINKFHGAMLTNITEKIPINKNNLLLRGCILCNTDFIEGIVVYAGHETKALLNNRGPRYKRSKLERQINHDVIWCVILLSIMCILCSVGTGVWLVTFPNVQVVPFIPYESLSQYSPLYQGFIRFWTFIIVFQVVIPLSLYVTIEVVKLGQVYFIQQDTHLYHAPTDQRLECRALNITEDLGQVEYVFSDKTGTLTENKMAFKSCSIGGVDYAYHDKTGAEGDYERTTVGQGYHLHVDEVDDEEDEQDEEQPYKKISEQSVNTKGEEALKPDPELQQVVAMMTLEEAAVHVPTHVQRVWDFFLLLTVCNTVVVSLHGHVDKMDASGYVAEDSPPASSSAHSSMRTTPDVLQRLRGLGPDVGNALRRQRRKLRNMLRPNSPPYNDGRVPLENEEEPITDPVSPASPPGFEVGARVSDLDDYEVLTDIDTSVMSENTLQTKYEAESPDELALVKAACTYGCRLLQRTANQVKIWLPREGELCIQVLHVLQFDAVRKCMSVIIKHPATNDIILYCKGADSAVLNNLQHWEADDCAAETLYRETQKSLTDYAKHGLRTLCMAKRVIPFKEYRAWLKYHQEAECATEDRDRLLHESACRVEHSLQLLGVTGIEDRLQDGVPQTIASLREAGMKVWVLTGDKQETALNIAYSCQLLSFDQEVMVLNAKNRTQIKDLIDSKLEQFELLSNQLHGDNVSVHSANGSTSFNSQKDVAMVIDGKTLSYALEDNLQKDFLLLAQCCSSVLCCRATPYQKAAVVKLVRDKLKKLTLAIGDGANDVSMIQTADVGIGISGNEGMQAVMASDFAMARFRYLKRLLLVHGHWCYDRLARMTLYMFFKNTVFVILLMWFQLYSGFSGGTMLDDLNLIFFNLIYTSLPPVIFGVFDRDIKAQTLIRHPWLYEQGPKGWVYRKHSYFINILDAIWQSLVEFYVPYFAYTGSNSGLWEFGLTCNFACILATLLHLCIESKFWNVFHVVGMAVSFVLFFGFNLVFGMVCVSCSHPASPYMVAQQTFCTPQFWLCSLLTAVIALAPRFLVRTLQGTFWQPPSVRAKLVEKHDNLDPTCSHYVTWSSTNSTNTGEPLPPDTAINPPTPKHHQPTII